MPTWRCPGVSNMDNLYNPGARVVNCVQFRHLQFSHVSPEAQEEPIRDFLETLGSFIGSV